MKILQIINSLNVGGAEKLVVDSVLIYQAKGLEVDVLTLDNTNTSFRTKLEEQSNGKVTGLSNRSIYNPLLIFKLIPYLKKYDLIHMHLFPTLYWGVIAKILSFSNVKLIYTEHSTNNRRRGNIVLKFMDRFIYKRLNKIVTIANEVDSEVKKHLGIDERNFHLIENGVDVESFHNAHKYSKSKFFSEEDFILIQVSSFRWQKDHKTLIEAMSLLPENIKLLLVGTGNLINEFKLLVKDLGLDDRVKFLGIRSDIPQLLKTADVVVLSSKHEGLSLSNIEGMSASRPFVASNVPGLREIVKDYGVLFEKGDSEDLAGKIINLKDNADFRNMIAVKCYQRAKEFDIKIMVDKYIKLYNEILNEKT